MKVSNVFSAMALVAFVATLSMPFASEAAKKKHHGKKASHSQSHKKSSKKKAAAPQAEAAPEAQGALGPLTS